MENYDVTKQVQHKEREMLAQLAEIFEKNDIPFFLSCGTALGCVRHQGFIPWDDDVDLYVFGTDYDRIREVFATQDTGNLELHDYTTVEGYPYSFPKIVAKDTVLVEGGMTHLSYRGGVYMDLFLLIQTNDNPRLRALKEWKRYFYYSILRGYYFNQGSGVRKILTRIIRALFNPQRVQEKLYRIYTHRYGQCEYLADISWFRQISLLRRSWFKKRLIMPFEGLDLPVPEGYDEYLRQYYGDYMTLPPEDKRVSNHVFETLILNKDEGSSK